MLKQCYTLILIGLMLVGCTHKVQHTKQITVNVPHTTVQQYRKISSFTQIDVQGRVNINVHTGYKKPQVLLKGDPRDLAQVKAVVSLSTLYIALGEGYPRYGAVSADIRGGNLTKMRYVGAGSITGNKIQTRYLDLYLENAGSTVLNGTIGLHKLEVIGDGTVQIGGISSPNLEVILKGAPKVKLTGYIKMRHLEIDGPAWLTMYWLKSDFLTIRATQAAKIQMAGVVNKLDVELWGTAKFEGRHLRAKRSFVKTHDKSIAEISSLNHQSNLATDASDIYYFNLPDTRADFMAYDGSVLDMRDLWQSDIKDSTRYNKQFP